MKFLAKNWIYLLFLAPLAYAVFMPPEGKLQTLLVLCGLVVFVCSMLADQKHRKQATN